MSREIKFRALTKNNNFMVFGDLITCPNGENRIIWFELKGESPLDVDYNDFNEIVQSSTIGQFTGLLDKNGKEIYENDVLKRVTVFEDGSGADIHFGVIKYSDCSFYSHSIKNEISRSLGGKSDNTTYEVIGNIYENPELLK